MLDEHAEMKQPALVIFGANSSGKTSFIQRFVGIGNILPSDFGPVTARIVQLTYAPAERACFRVYKTIEKVVVECEGALSHFFENQQEVNWDGIAAALLSHVKRPSHIDQNSTEFQEWAKCFVEVSLPSNVLSLGIDVYDTPGFLSDNREQVLIENLHELVKRNKPTLLFLYDNAVVSDTDKSCFLAMRSALGSLERVSTFFLNTKADCISIANDYSLDDDPENVPLDLFVEKLQEKRQHCYELLLRRREMASEVLGDLPDSVNQCTFFDICTIPKDFDPWEIYTNLINTATFQRIVEFAVESYAAPTLLLAKDILATIDDYFDLVVSTTLRIPTQWEALRVEALDWGRTFFDEYEKILPSITDNLIENIFKLFEELKSQIARQAALTQRTDDPIDSLLQDNAKSVRDYVRLAVQEQVIKVAANDVIINKRDEIRALIAGHFQRQHDLRKNELLVISQRQVLGELPVGVLQQNYSLNIFVSFITRISIGWTRFRLSLPTRLSAYKKEFYNRFLQSKVMNDDKGVYELLDAMDAYSTLSNEASRRKFADFCLTELAAEITKQKEMFGLNLATWVKEQRKAFDKNVQSNYKYVTAYLANQQTIHNLILELSGSFAKIECQLLSAIELAKRKGIAPILGGELGRGGFYNVHAAEWGSEKNLAAKKLFDPSNDNLQMAALEAHYHRIATLLHLDHIVPLLYVYENEINANQRELWLIMSKYPRSLRQYLKQHIHEITFPRVISFALIIATALADFHRLEIVHRDLKTSNIMLDENEQCYIIDFGTVKFGLFNRTLLGTAPLPPEMLAAHLKNPTEFVHYNGAAADVYSFGLLLYEMLPKPAYEQLSVDALSRLEEQFQSIPRSEVFAKDYENLIHKCLDPNPTKRPNAVNLISELRRIQEKTEVKLCVICEDQERGIRCVPCGHKVTCAQCWESWCAVPDNQRRCILCKAIVTGETDDRSNATYFVQ